MSIRHLYLVKQSENVQITENKTVAQKVILNILKKQLKFILIIHFIFFEHCNKATFQKDAKEITLKFTIYPIFIDLTQKD